MVTLQKVEIGNRNVLEIVGKSSDVKPLNLTGGIEGIAITNGSTFFEFDTSKVFMFDADVDSWVEI